MQGNFTTAMAKKQRPVPVLYSGRDQHGLLGEAGLGKRAEGIKNHQIKV
jgi:hypothetical protein